MERGKSLSTMRNSAARSSVTSDRTVRKYASCAEHERSKVVQLGPMVPSRDRVMSKRAIMSARSSERPNSMKCQASSLDVVALESPHTTPARSRTHAK